MYILRCGIAPGGLIGSHDWTLKLGLHERLCAVFGASALPPFPPQLDFMSACFGVPMEMQAKRANDLQNYLDELCDRRDVVSTPAFQAALGIQVPEPIKHLRVRRWMKSAHASAGSALLDYITVYQNPRILCIS